MSATVKGIDINSGLTITALTTVFSSVVVQNVPQLTVQMNAPNLAIVPGNASVTMTATVSNLLPNAATANNVTLSLSSTGSAPLVAGTVNPPRRS